jgi:hypothetical protein
MPSPRLIAIITARMLFTTAPGAHAAYTIDQLREIERLILSKDCGGLRNYIGVNPGLLSGTDPLASELRSFASGVDTGLIECLSFRPAPATQADTVTALGTQLY